ncbi:GNAT family N-acetyltransferase [Streptomyces bottropensis]|uniref:GNAT family N-acetyltransferase n=1 Tax=Streptomyces bottropensis TaxID=42235 RepID=UPI0036B168D0
MAATQPTLTDSVFDPTRDEDVDTLVRLYGDYLVEELERTGHMVPGMAVAGFLRTEILRMDGEPAGFVSADLARYSVEVIYVSPGFRGMGAATLVLANMVRTCPQPLALKAPLSPGGEALAARLGLRVSEPTPEQARDVEESVRDGERMMMLRCRHKRTGDPRKPCMRCYRPGVRRYADGLVRRYAAEVRAVRLLANSARPPGAR